MASCWTTTRRPRRSAEARDITEFLYEIGYTPPTAPGALVGKVAYDEPCHLLHAQKISAAPRRSSPPSRGSRGPARRRRRVLRRRRRLLAAAARAVQAVASRKIEAIRRSGATIVATGNPGCLMQIRNGVSAAGLDVKVVHPGRAAGRRLPTLPGLTS